MNDKANEVRKGEELDWQSLETYLRQAIPELEGDMQVAQFHGGHANLTYLITLGDTELVVRRPPFGKIAPGAHDMKREYRVLSKLYKHFPQAPRAYHFCDDEAIIGAPFVVMERKSGVVIRTKLLDCFKEFERAEERLTDALIQALAQLHTVDVEKAELTQLGKPDGFLQRQVAGWTKRWNLSKTKEVPDMDTVLAKLNEDIPKAQAVAIIHNDIKFDNCQFQPDNPDEVTAIFDWDMTTLGDPLVDFATLLMYWPDYAFNQKYQVPPLLKLEGNFPNRTYLIEKYAAHTGFSMDRMNWYQAFALIKLAVISQQLYQRFVLGKSTDARMEKFGLAAESFSRIAIDLLRV